MQDMQGAVMPLFWVPGLQDVHLHLQSISRPELKVLLTRCRGQFSQRHLWTAGGAAPTATS